MQRSGNWLVLGFGSCMLGALCLVALNTGTANAQIGTKPAGALHSLITQPVDESRLTTLTGNTYPLARPEFDLGPAPASLPMQRMLLVLKRSPEQEAALRKLVDDQQDKASPRYHQWLMPEEFGKQFGPADADIQTITRWLQAHGFQVDASSKGRTVIEFSGSAGQVQEAFHTAIHKYLLNGEPHWANDRDPQIPAALAQAVAGIDSLHSFPRTAMHQYVGQYSVKTHQLTSSAKPGFTVACGNGKECYFLTPFDFATIYDVQALWTSSIDGSGQTIAIVGRTDVYAQDATNFWQLFGLTIPANKLNIIYNGYPPEVNGDEPEADIDIQWSGAVAPQATIDFVTSESTETTDGVDLSALYIVDNNLAPVMSESYGECELGLGTTGNQFYYSLWEQAAAQGISVFVSSGDNGSAACDNPAGPAQYGLNVNGIASTPFNAAIGGTDFNQYKTWSNYWNSTNNSATQESAKGYIPETTWNDSCTNSLAITLGYGSTAEQACNNQQMIQQGGVNSTAGSGGPSNCAVNTQGVIGSCTQSYPKPSWQRGTGVPADNKRDLPDVSLFASNGFLGSAYLICEQDKTGGCSLNDLLGYGGTSVASPAFAGIMSLVNEKMGGPQGVPGFALYQLASKQTNAFHDAPTGSTIAMPCVTGSPNCVTKTSGDAYGVLSGYSTNTAYDLATGLGSVDAANLVNNWSKASITATTTTLSLNSGKAVNITHGAAVPVSIAVSSTAASGAASLLVSNATGTTIGQAIDGFPLTNGATAITAATSRLPGGSNYYVLAHYGGDGTYGGSYSTPMTVTVQPENSQPAVFLVTFDYSGHIINGNATTAVYGSSYLLRANVENSAGKLCAPLATSDATACPTGTITLTDNGSPLDAGSYTLNSYGYAEDKTVQLPGGTDSVKAQYSGDVSFIGSTATQAFTISPATTTATLFSNMALATVGQSFYLYDTIQAESFGAFPTGTITFTDNGNPMPGTVTYQSLNCGNIYYVCLDATLVTSVGTGGTHAIAANYSGDGNYTSNLTSLSLPAKYLPTVTVNSSAQTVSAGQSVTLTALVDATVKNPVITGTVTFVGSSGAISGTPTIITTTDPKGNSVLQATLTTTLSLSESVSAEYSGDGNYLYAAGSIFIPVTDFSISTSPQVAVTQGSSQTVAINVSPLNGFSGAVSNFSCSGLPAETSCNFNPTIVTGSGSTTLTITTTPLGQMQQTRRTANDSHGFGWRATTMLSLLGICAIGVPAWRRKRAALLVSALLVLLVFLPTCGGGGGGSVTNNPVPSISSLSPTQQAAGSQSQKLTINGSGFISGSTMTYNGVAHAATYGGATQLSTTLSASDLANAGTFPVVVTNPSPGGGSSNAANFNVAAGTPTGTFTVTVTATSSTLSHSTTFTLVVQ